MNWCECPSVCYDKNVRRKRKNRNISFYLLQRTLANSQQEDETETLYLVLLLEQRTAVTKQPKPG